jgi:hypothetical protein
MFWATKNSASMARGVTGHSMEPTLREGTGSRIHGVARHDRATSSSCATRASGRASC